MPFQGPASQRGAPGRVMPGIEALLTAEIAGVASWAPAVYDLACLLTSEEA